MSKFYLFIAFILLGFTVRAGEGEEGGNGTVTGKVIEVVNGQEQAVPFANVYVVETSKGTTTDFDGKFLLSIKPGNYHVVVSFIGFSDDTSIVTVREGENTELNVNLSQNAEEFDVYEVITKQNKESEVALIMERRESTGIEQNIGAEELTKTGSSDVASGLTKVVGLSVVGSKHVFVRGMGDRYNSAYLNQMPIASVDPDKKVIPLDIFTTSVVKSLSVNKAFTPNLYGDFSGGAIDIRTKDYPDEPTLNVSLGSSWNSQSTFKPFMTYEGGKWDYWGVDDGTRDIPDPIAATDDYDSRVSQETNSEMPFAPNYNPINTTAPLNSSFSLFAGDFFELSKKNKFTGIGVLFLASHSEENAYQQGEYNLIRKQGTFQVDYDYEKFAANTNSTVLGNVHFQLMEGQKVSYNFLTANMSSDESRVTSGDHFDYQDHIFSRRYAYIESNLMVNQFNGDHHFLPNDRLRISWSVSNNVAKSKEPDRRQLVYLYDDNDNYRFNVIDRIDNHRFFSELEESEWTKRVGVAFDVTHREAIDEYSDPEANWTVSLGFQQKNKERTQDFRQFIYDLGDFAGNIDQNTPDSYINSDNLDQGVYYIDEVNNAASQNEASLDINAYWANTTFDVSEKLNVSTGLRLEQGTQLIKFRDQQQPIFLKKNVLDELAVLPALNLKYSVNETQFLRFSGSKTISRPGFKEVAPFLYVEYFAGMKSQGFPELINGTNYNADLRYEVYPSLSELIAITAFGKFLQNPIERVQLATASGQLQSYRNAKEAYVAGIEFEIRKKLDSIFGNVAILKDVSAGMNAAYIYSQVEIGQDSGGVSVIQTNDKRALQGASPYLINFDLSHEKRFSESLKLRTSIAYNVFGPRISSVGIQGLGDVYEKPVHRLNLIVRADIKDHWGAKLSVKNILNPTVRRTQESDAGNIDVGIARQGITVGLSITYKVFAD